MNFIQNQAAKFSIKNCVIALAAMIALGVLMVVTGTESAPVIWVMSAVAIIVSFKAFDMFSTKQEASAQEEASTFQQATVLSLTDYRTVTEETEVAA